MIHSFIFNYFLQNVLHKINKKKKKKREIRLPGTDLSTFLYFLDEY